MPDYKDDSWGENISAQLTDNRVADALRFREDRDAKTAARNPLMVKEPDFLKQKLEYLRFIDRKYRKEASKREKISLNYLRSEMRLLKAQLKPRFYHKVMFHPQARALRNYVTGYYLAHRQQERELKEIKEKVMHRRGYENISGALSKEKLSPNEQAALKQMIGMNLPSFSLPFTDDNYPEADFVMHCAKIPGTDVYYIKKLDVVSCPSNESLIKGNARNVKYTVDMGDKQALAAVQAASLVNGKMVCVEGNNWLRLDPGRTGREDAFQLVRYDLGKALHELPLAEQSRRQLPQMAAALRMGKSWDVTLELNGGQQKCVLSVNPEQRKLQLQDATGSEVLLSKPPEQLNSNQAKVAQMLLDKGLQVTAGQSMDMSKQRSFSL